MKKILLAIAALTTLGLAACGDYTYPNNPYTSEQVTYDEFNDVTTQNSPVVCLSDNEMKLTKLCLTTYVSVEGKHTLEELYKISEDPVSFGYTPQEVAIAINFTYRADDWIFAERLEALIDGKKVTLSTEWDHMDKDVSSYATISESSLVFVDLNNENDPIANLFLALDGGKTVKFKIVGGKGVHYYTIN